MEQTHPNLTLIHDFFSAYTRNDLEGIKKVLDKDIKWHIPGAHPLSGTKTGVDEVLQFFKQLSKGAFKAETFKIFMQLFHLGARAENADGIKNPIWSENAIELKITEIYNQLKPLIK